MACSVSEGGVTVTAQLTFRKKRNDQAAEHTLLRGAPAFFICADCYIKIIMNDEITMYIDSGQSTCCGISGETINMLWVAGEIYSNVRVGTASGGSS